MKSSIRFTSSSERSDCDNDCLIMMPPPHLLPLDELLLLEEVLPIETEDLMKSFSSLNLSAGRLVFESHRKQVCFGGIQSIQRIESSWDMTPQDITDRWYSPVELKGFKQAARDLCKARMTGKSVEDNDEDDSTRGMDVYFPPRQRHQAKYISHVLKAIHVNCVGQPEFVAMLCEKWSHRVTLEASQRALYDYYDAHYPSMLKLLKPQQPQKMEQELHYQQKDVLQDARIQTATLSSSGATRPNNKRAGSPLELRAPIRTRSH